MECHKDSGDARKDGGNYELDVKNNDEDDVKEDEEDDVKDDEEVGVDEAKYKSGL